MVILPFYVVYNNIIMVWMHMMWNVVLYIKVINVFMDIYFIFWTKSVHDVYCLCKRWTNGKQSRMILALTCWVFNCRFPQSRSFVIGQMLLSLSTLKQCRFHVIYLVANDAPPKIYLFCVISHMSKRCAAAELVVCGGCHESFVWSTSHINQSTVC